MSLMKNPQHHFSQHPKLSFRSPDTIKILVVEDHEIVRNGLHSLLIQQQQIEVVGLAESGEAALALLEGGLQVDIVLTDLNMPGMNGIELTTRIVSFSNLIKVFILTMHDAKTFEEMAKQAGASGYISKDGDFNALMEMIRAVYTEQ